MFGKAIKSFAPDLSRIARNTRDLLSIVDDLQNKDVAFQSLKEAIDTTTPQGQFMLTVFGALAQLLNVLTASGQRTEEGRRIAMQEGRITGRPRVQVDEKEFRAICSRWRSGEISAVEAQRSAGLKSNTFYRRVKQLNL